MTAEKAVQKYQFDDSTELDRNNARQTHIEKLDTTK